MAFHGYPRFAGDIDFFLHATDENALRVLDVLREFGFSKLDVGVADLVTPDKAIQLGRPPNRIDLLTSISGVGPQRAISAARDRVGSCLAESSSSGLLGLS